MTHSPATGRIASELILDGRASLLDAFALGVERFAEGRLIEEIALLSSATDARTGK